MDGELIRGHVGTMLLCVLACGPAHGYGIAVELKRRSEGRLDLVEGSLYPALQRLELAGLVASNWEVSDGRRRRLYSLTADGKAELHRQGEVWRELKAFMDELLESTGA